MVTAVFKNNNTERVRGLWQYDYGQVLRIQGLILPTAVEIDFSLQETGGESTSRVGITRDGVTDVVIPDSMLENGGATQDYSIYAFIYLTDETSGKTIKKIIMSVTSRPKPEAFDAPEDAELFREAIAAVNKSAVRAETAEASAEAWAHGHADYPERDEDNAKYYADESKKYAEETKKEQTAVSELAEHIDAVAMQVNEDKTDTDQYKNQASASAAKSLQSEQAAKSSENAAMEAKAGAEAAEGQAELFANQTAEDKSAVEAAKTLIIQMGQKVSDNKASVEQTVSEFELEHQQAVADVNNAGQAQTERVEGAGDQAIKDINAAGTTQISAINSAGEQQVKAVEDAGSAQVSAVQEAAAEIIADRDQIAENKNGISELKGDLDELEDDIGIVTDNSITNLTQITMDGWYYINDTASRIELHSTRGSRTYLIDVSDKPERIRISVSNNANRCRMLYIAKDIDDVSTGDTGLFVDGGNQREFVLSAEDYDGYKTIAINTDYNRDVSYSDYALVSNTAFFNKISKINDRIAAFNSVIVGGTTEYTPITMNGWYYVNTIGRLDIHQSSGARTYLIDLTTKPSIIHIELSNANRCRFLWIDVSANYVKDGTVGTYEDKGSERVFNLTPSEYGEYKTLAINTDYNRGTSGTFATVYATFTDPYTVYDRKARQDIANLKESQTTYRASGLVRKADLITDGTMVLCTHIDNKKNASYDFWCNVDSNFTSVSVGHGYNVSYSGYATVDATYLTWYTSNGVQQNKEPHGLDISGFIHVSIEQDDNAKANVKIMSSGGEYTMSGLCTFAGCRGDVFAKAVGTVTNAVLSANFRDIKKDVWVFGDSYVSMADPARWPYYAVASNHTNFYLNGFGGANSSHAIASFREMIEFAEPKVVIWAVGMNNSDTTVINTQYQSYVDEVISVCKEKGITVILCTIPNTPTRKHIHKNAYIKSSGYRYVDFACAVGAESEGSTWYEGMLEGSNTEAAETLNERVHPTALGAKALYNRLITDAPEMMN